MNKQDHNFTDMNIPDDGRIEMMLGKFQPLPSARFERMSQKSPWMRIHSGTQNHFKGNFNLYYKLSISLIIGIAVLSLLGVLFIPSIRTAARQIINNFFISPSNQIFVTVTAANPDDLFRFSDPEHFPDSIQKIKQLAGFDLKQISALPDGLQLVGSRYDPDYGTITTLYQADNFKLFLSQRPIGTGKDVFSVGSEAIIELVNVGKYPAEYVAGGWKSIATTQTTTSGGETSIRAVWDGDLPQYTLRWQTEDTSFELREIGEGALSQTNLINLANGLK